jgi:hypothetical protein
MPWANLDDHFHDNPKVLETPLPAVGLYAIGLSYCNAQLSDGFIPRSVLVGIRGWAAAATALVEHRFWEPAEGGGYRVHDYLDWNPSREQRLADRAAARQRKAQSRDRRPAGQTPAVTPGQAEDVTPGQTPHVTPGKSPDVTPGKSPDVRYHAQPSHSTPDGLRPSPDPPNPLPDAAADGAPPRRGSQECPICSRAFIGPYSDHKCDPLKRPKRLPGLGRLLPKEAREAPPAEVLAELETLDRTRAERQAEAQRMLEQA